MQKQKIRKIKPDRGCQTAGIRAPGTGILTKVPEYRENRNHPGLAVKKNRLQKTHLWGVALDMITHGMVGFMPCLNSVPGGRQIRMDLYI